MGLTAKTELVKAPVPIIGVASIDAALGRMKGAGGKQFTAREEVDAYGYSSYVEDTEAA